MRCMALALILGGCAGLPLPVGGNLIGPASVAGHTATTLNQQRVQQEHQRQQAEQQRRDAEASERARQEEMAARERARLDALQRERDRLALERQQAELRRQIEELRIEADKEKALAQAQAQEQLGVARQAEAEAAAEQARVQAAKEEQAAAREQQRAAAAEQRASQARAAAATEVREARAAGRVAYSEFQGCVTRGNIPMSRATRVEVSDGALYTGMFPVAKGGFVVQADRAERVVQAQVVISAASMEDADRVRTLGAVYVVMSRCLTSGEVPLERLLAEETVTMGRAKYSRRKMDTSIIFAIEMK